MAMAMETATGVAIETADNHSDLLRTASWASFRGPSFFVSKENV